MIMKKLKMLAIIIVLIGAFKWLLLGVVPGFNKNALYNPNLWVNRIVYILVGVAALFLVVDKYLYLPFLGESVFPENVLIPTVPYEANVKVEVEVPENYRKSKFVIYWASNPTEDDSEINSYDIAYADTKNVGVVQVEEKEKVELSLLCPQKYTVWGKELPRHVHYRFASFNNMMGPVFTKKFTC